MKLKDTAGSHSTERRLSGIDVSHMNIEELLKEIGPFVLNQFFFLLLL